MEKLRAQLSAGLQCLGCVSVCAVYSPEPEEGVMSLAPSSGRIGKGLMGELVSELRSGQRDWLAFI